MTPTQIHNPKHILLLHNPSCPPTPILTTLLNSSSPPSSSLPQDQNQQQDQQQTHQITTKYYTARIPIWHDTISSPTSWREEWSSQSGAADVVRAVGAWILVFDLSSSKDSGLELVRDTLQAVADVVLLHTEDADSYVSAAGAGESAVLIAVGVGGASTAATGTTLDAQSGAGAEDWEEICLDAGGWEFIDASLTGRNEFGEVLGLERLVQALQAVDWENDVEAEEGEEELLGGTESEEGEEDGDSDVELQRELQKVLGMDDGMRQPMLSSSLLLRGTADNKEDGTGTGNGGIAEEDEEEEDPVDELQTMLLKLQAARDLGADLPPSERRKLAAHAVKEVMRM